MKISMTIRGVALWQNLRDCNEMGEGGVTGVLDGPCSEVAESRDLSRL